MTMDPTAHSNRRPNLYELHRKSLHVTYSTTSLDGRARLHYVDGRVDKSYVGEEIQVADIGIGRLITVMLEVVPDLRAVTFSMLLPDVHVEREAHIETEGLYTTARTSIGGPALVKGQIQTYRAVALSGTARAVEF